MIRNFMVFLHDRTFFIHSFPITYVGLSVYLYFLMNHNFISFAIVGGCAIAIKILNLFKNFVNMVSNAKKNIMLKTVRPEMLEETILGANNLAMEGVFGYERGGVIYIVTAKRLDGSVKITVSSIQNGQKKLIRGLIEYDTNLPFDKVHLERYIQ